MKVTKEQGGIASNTEPDRTLTLSVSIICFNEEQNLRRCLESVSWADEVVIADSMSRDRTLEIARQYTDKVFQRNWTGYRDQKNFALSKCQGEWILSLDADEQVSEPLREEILGEIRRPQSAEGYSIPRRSFYQGRWISHCGFYPDRQLRLFKRGIGTWVGGRVHERVEVRGRVGHLKSDLLHFPYQGSISGLVRKVDAFSSLMAEDMLDRGKRYHLGYLVTRPVTKFIEVYFLKLGFLDGLPGLIIATMSAFTMFARYSKLRELEILRGGGFTS
jgi:glycosyltransferase involved in cell wall biosynthesis